MHVRALCDSKNIVFLLNKWLETHSISCEVLCSIKTSKSFVFLVTFLFIYVSVCVYTCANMAERKQHVTKCKKCYCLRKFQEYLSHLVIVTDKLYSQYLTVGRAEL